MNKKRFILLFGIIVAILSNLKAFAKDINYHHLYDAKMAICGHSPVSHFEVGILHKGREEFKSAGGDVKDSRVCTSKITNGEKFQTQAVFAAWKRIGIGKNPELNE